jgi:hypothetical protein
MNITIARSPTSRLPASRISERAAERRGSRSPSPPQATVKEQTMTVLACKRGIACSWRSTGVQRRPRRHINARRPFRLCARVLAEIKGRFAESSIRGQRRAAKSSLMQCFVAAPYSAILRTLRSSAFYDAVGLAQLSRAVIAWRIFPRCKAPDRRMASPQSSSRRSGDRLRGQASGQNGHGRLPATGCPGPERAR